uniref:Uncharacterized protein n=1 Tax=Panagrolaimus sp. ES5 TaxID=591445 RepID=A0AC34G3N6_9BILA
MVRKDKRTKEYLTLNEFISEEIEKRRQKKLRSSSNSSTLSLHIAAYENSIEDDKSEPTQLSKSTNATLGFEFLRQQDDQTSKPEIMQFRASQRLRNPNEENLNNNDQSNIVQQQINTTAQPPYRAASSNSISPIREAAGENADPDATLRSPQWNVSRIPFARSTPRGPAPYRNNYVSEETDWSFVRNRPPGPLNDQNDAHLSGNRPPGPLNDQN